MKTILSSLARFDVEGADPPPPERVLVFYQDMVEGQAGYTSPTSRRPVLRRLRGVVTADNSPYFGTQFWVDPVQENPVPLPTTSTEMAAPFADIREAMARQSAELRSRARANIAERARAFNNMWGGDFPTYNMTPYYHGTPPSWTELAGVIYNPLLTPESNATEP